MELKELLREEIRNSGISLCQMAKDIEVDKGTLSRFINGGSCKIETAEKLLNHFKYKLVKKKGR